MPQRRSLCSCTCLLGILLKFSFTYSKAFSAESARQHRVGTVPKRHCFLWGDFQLRSLRRPHQDFSAPPWQRYPRHATAAERSAERGARSHPRRTAGPAPGTAAPRTAFPPSQNRPPVRPVPAPPGCCPRTWLRRRRRGGCRGALRLPALLLGLPLAAARPAAGHGSPGDGRRLIALLPLLLAALGLAQDIERVRLVVQELAEAIGDGAPEVLLHDGTHRAAHQPRHHPRGHLASPTAPCAHPPAPTRRLPPLRGAEARHTPGESTSSARPHAPPQRPRSAAPSTAPPRPGRSSQWNPTAHPPPPPSPPPISAAEPAHRLHARPPSNRAANPGARLRPAPGAQLPPITVQNQTCQSRPLTNAMRRSIIHQVWAPPAWQRYSPAPSGDGPWRQPFEGGAVTQRCHRGSLGNLHPPTSDTVKNASHFFFKILEV